MPHHDGDDKGQWRYPGAEDAESTHFRPFVREAADYAGHDDAPTPDLSYFTATNSIRVHTHATSWSLAAKIAVPILAAMLVCFFVIGYIIQDRVSELQLNDIKSKAYPVARAIGKFGRILITWRDKFMQQHPEYDSASEWVVSEHWLVTGGFISANRLAGMIGAGPNSLVSIETLERAEARAALLNLAELGVDDGDATNDSEMVGAYVLDLSRRPVAASLDLNVALPGNDPTLWRRPETDSPAAAGGAGQGDSGDVSFDFIQDRGQGNLLRIAIPVTRNAIDQERIGTAVVVFRTDRIAYEHRDLIVLIFVLMLLLLIFMSLVCWWSARRVTLPLRQLTADLHAVAEGDLSRRSTISGSHEIGMLAQAFNSMAERMRVARLNAMEANRLDSDLAVAKSIQNSLLPPQTPRIRGLDIFSSYRPAKEIGGDYFDFLPVDNLHMGVVIADASGKSIPAALVMSTTRAVLRFVAPGGLSAAETLTRVNAILSVDIPRGMFVTAYYLILNPLDNSMVCASAGHNPLLIGRADGSVELVNPGGIALGFDQGPIFQRSIKEQKVKLGSGDRVLMYTDGVVECANIENEEYSDRRLQEFLRRHRGLSSSDFMGALLADLDRHRGAADIRDDTTVVTFKVL